METPFIRDMNWVVSLISRYEVGFTSCVHKLWMSSWQQTCLTLFGPVVNNRRDGGVNAKENVHSISIVVSPNSFFFKKGIKKDSFYMNYSNERYSCFRNLWCLNWLRLGRKKSLWIPLFCHDVFICHTLKNEAFLSSAAFTGAFAGQLELSKQCFQSCSHGALPLT